MFQGQTTKIISGYLQFSSRKKQFIGVCRRNLINSKYGPRKWDEIFSGYYRSHRGLSYAGEEQLPSDKSVYIKDTESHQADNVSGSDKGGGSEVAEYDNQEGLQQAEILPLWKRSRLRGSKSNVNKQQKRVLEQINALHFTYTPN